MAEQTLHRMSRVGVPKGTDSPDTVIRSKAVNRDDRARGQQILLEAHGYYAAMDKFRRERDRNKRYNYGDQWGDMIEVDGVMMTEEQYIKSQGQVPLKNNLIRRLVKNVMGGYNSQSLEPTCIARDRSEQPLAETMNTLLHYNMDLNRMAKMYSSALEEFLISGLPVHRKMYGWKKDRMDCWTETVQPNNFFVDNHMRDMRMWDCSVVGELHDLTFDELCTALAKTPTDYRKLAEIYRQSRDTSGTIPTWADFGFGRRKALTDFLVPSEGNLCRVIEVWRKESKPRYRCHDYNTGDLYKVDPSDLGGIVAENNRRRAMAARNGIPDEEVPYIRTEWFMDSYWYYYFLSPMGDILDEGETPYLHKSHPYVFVAYPFIDGEIHSFIGDVIDQQRYTNRLITLNDWIVRVSAKGALLIPEDAIPEGMSVSDFADTWAKFNGVVVYKPSKTGDVPKQISANSTNIGISEMLSLQLKFFEDISGVNGALQGKAAFSGESGSHAQVMAQNAATSLIDLYASFNEFVRESAFKDVKNMQQYYDGKMILNIVGQTKADLSQISDAEFDFSIIQSTSSQSYRASANDFLISLFKANAISLKQMLEVAKDLPYADALLQSIESQEQAVANGQVPEGISPQLVQQVNSAADEESVQQLRQAMGAPSTT